MARIRIGSSSEVKNIARRSASRAWMSAARPSISGSLPVASPEAIRWISTGGNSLVRPGWLSSSPAARSARASENPSRTRCVASRTRVRMARLFTVSPAACRARSIGTPPPARIASVLAKRAVFSERLSTPTTGIRSSRLCQRMRIASTPSSRRTTNAAITTSASRIQP
ncbi:MAG: hypothetical protein H6R03_1847 [Burkholderiaceae bacterium]|nr:hypothetical protein [Burkholderiaceae bacterium]